jgi:hypothetical protein
MEQNAPGSRAETDRFYHGRIDKLFRGNQTGLILSESGRELFFEYFQVRIVGSIRDFEGLREGMEVGFDVGRTSKGLRVTLIRTGEDMPPPQSEAQGSAAIDTNSGSPTED